MRIEIASRLRPFSHAAGTRCILPGTTIPLEIFPALVRMGDKEIPIAIEGPVDGFTVQLDLERPSVHVWGFAASGYFRYRIQAEGIIHNNEIPLPQAVVTERLSLGCHKAQDWEMVSRRADLSEILPHWFCLGQLTPGNFAPFEMDLQNLFKAGFHGILAPRLIDEQHQGILLPKVDNALAFLTEGSKQIRALFLQERAGAIDILPELPPAFHAGRLLTKNLDMEWSKKTIRRLIFRATKFETLQFQFRDVKSFKLNGEKRTCDLPIVVEPGIQYDLDRFEK